MQNEKHKSLPIDQQSIQLGMKINKVKMILGEPNEKQVDGEFQSWQYLDNKNASNLLFRNGMLIKIEK